MFCPGCGRYLNSNVMECPYCSADITARVQSRTEMMEKSKTPGIELNNKTEDPPKSPIKNIKKEPLLDFSNRFFFFAFISSIALALCMFLPWTIWNGGDVHITYNAIDMLSFKWESSSLLSKYLPMIVSMCGIVSLLGLLLRNRKSCTVCVSFASGLFSLILIFIFAIMIYLGTGLSPYYGLGIALIFSLILTMCTLNIAEGFKCYRKKKKQLN
ncbi:MAG: hypothetical protein KRP56_06070 [Candidatus Methanogranum gryphiswaldense]|nr:MAG: hypothetical protein KRP56_06070 [Candidatus Methanogranum sp. U3.2.1]